MFRMIYVIKLSNVGALYGELVRMNEVFISGQKKFNFTCLIDSLSCWWTDSV